MRELWVIGDIHGALDKLRAMLLRAGLIDFDGSWMASDAHLVFLGDYLDRGPSGVDVIRLIRSLEVQAQEVGGQVTALLGNHEVMFLAAWRFRRNDPTDQLGFQEYWTSNGGQDRDVDLLEPSDAAWLAERPAMTRVGNWLMIHADSMFYQKLGNTVQEVNERVQELMQSRDPDTWGTFLNVFTDRFAFSFGAGEQAAWNMLRTYGGDRIVHGHTPVYVLMDEHIHGPTVGPGAPLPYASKLCLGMDSGMAYRDDAGFIARLDSTGLAEVITFPSGAPQY